MFGKGLAADFNCSPPSFSLVNKNVSFEKGCASISDECGNLKFYTDGDSIWHFSHMRYQDTVFPLNGSKLATQSSVILPSRTVSGKYYLFTMDDVFGISTGLSVTEITNVFNTPGTFPPGGANQILVKNTNDMIAAIDHKNGSDYWVVVKLKNSSEFRSYLVSDILGTLNITEVTSLGGITGDESGQMKISPDGQFLVITRPLQIFKFNNNTGNVKPYLDFKGPKDNWLNQGNSIAFSASGEKLFVANYGSGGSPFGTDGIYQLDLTLTDTAQIKNLVINVASPKFEVAGGMQLGPDGKIYFLESKSATKVGVINFPEKSGSDAGVVRGAYQLPGVANMFFPTFNQSLFYKKNPFNEFKICSNEVTDFEVNDPEWEDETGGTKIDSLHWKFGDPLSGATDSSNLPKPQHRYTAPGCYNVQLTLFVGGKVLTRNKRIRIKPAPTLEFGSRDSALCFRPRELFLFASTVNNPGATYAWFYDTLNAPIGPAEGEDGAKLPFNFDEYLKTDLEGAFWAKKTWECCTAWDTVIVYYDSIVPSMKINDNLQCIRDNAFEFSNVSKPSIKQNSTKWNLGQGGIVAGETVNITYSKPGAYYPVMGTESGGGCKAQISRIVLVVKHPVANFFIDSAVQCFRGNLFTIKDSSTIEYGQGGLQNWNFDLGDSTTTHLKQFTKNYKKAGIYPITLVVNSSQDCKDTATAMVKVYEQPVAGFSVNDTSQCLSANDFIFTDTSTVAFDSINKRIWTYGDGTPQDNRLGLPLTFNRNYNKVDSFLISLKIGIGIGCFDTAKKYIYVHGDPYVDFSIDSAEQCLKNNVFNFKDTTFTEKGVVQQRIWNFGDSTPTGSSGKNKTYADYGAYTVKLRVVTNKGCTDSVAKNVLVNPMPDASFTVDKLISCFKNHSFTFSAASSFIPVGTIDAFNWDFGDSTTSNLKNPLPKVFANDKDKQVVLSLVSNKGCKDSALRVIKFYPTPIAVATVNNDVQCLEDNLFNYTANGSTTNGGNIKEYLWQFGDGTIDFGKKPNGKFYVNPDTFNVSLQITTDDGCVDTASLRVSVLPSPIANFSVEPTCLFQPSKFVNKSASSPGYITNWNWNLGDGTITTDSTPVHTYANTGNYTISLNVLSNFGCGAKATKVNEAEVKPLPQAKFGSEKIDFDEKNTTIQFLDSSIDANQWYWDLGKGYLSTIQNPRITYDDTATIPVTLIISNAKGCYDTLTKNVFVAPDFFFHVPNAFTPNNDILNPTYGGEGTLYYKEYNLKIFNRWGQLIFEANNPLERWDGTYNGAQCAEGQYTYIYRMRDVYGFYHNYKGMLTMFR